ncbi:MULTISPECIES: hypothetical protein [Comamonas]|uniref:hypothetical protein n=1 Tax=Comamonas TaxID=283 RepID=UPI00050E152D|nr:MULTISPECIES: hypothetical protein [Comamonas]KGG96645.1 hypothetical protein P367_18890 [Comamonas thiooxydans]KGG98699.1 hypothetical protein P365_22730 [Comamonas thiooxydans]KGH08039.1 hypothetical protein P368_20045 [Comamonas thiooxydans]TZG06299.1 hypothetical protein FZC30_23845 [Comamonas thiooxydans]UNV88671.1 hypothetical protein MP576_13515 [Comamonas sp. 7D-2evo1]
MTQIVQSQATTGVTFGVLAAQCGEVLPMQVLRSGGGFYLGTCTERGPFTRESLETWNTQAKAEKAWAKGHWCQKDHL